MDKTITLKMFMFTLLLGSMPIILILLFVVSFVKRHSDTEIIEELQSNQSDNQSNQSETESVDTYCSDSSGPVYQVADDVPNDLGDRMKYYEKKTMDGFVMIPPYLPFLIRMDGRAFSNLLSSLKTTEWKKHSRPYSLAFRDAMIETAKDLLYEFSPSTVYTHSDEITLIFPALCTYEEYKIGRRDDGKNISGHLYDGQLFKLISIVPSYTSTRFTYHLQRELTKHDSELVTKYFGEQDVAKKHGPVFSFDARPIVFPLTEKFEIANHMLWRSKLDCYRNFVAMYAERMIPRKELCGMKNSERVERLRALGVDMDDPAVDIFMKNGSYVKKEEFVTSDATRRRVKLFTLPSIKCDTSHIDFLLSKHTKDDPNVNVATQC